MKTANNTVLISGGSKGIGGRTQYIYELYLKSPAEALKLMHPGS